MAKTRWPAFAPMIASLRAGAETVDQAGRLILPVLAALQERPKRESLMIATSKWHSSHRRLQHAYISRWRQLRWQDHYRRATG